MQYDNITEDQRTRFVQIRVGDLVDIGTLLDRVAQWVHDHGGQDSEELALIGAMEIRVDAGVTKRGAPGGVLRPLRRAHLDLMAAEIAGADQVAVCICETDEDSRLDIIGCPVHGDQATTHLDDVMDETFGGVGKPGDPLTIVHDQEAWERLVNGPRPLAMGSGSGVLTHSTMRSIEGTASLKVNPGHFQEYVPNEYAPLHLTCEPRAFAPGFVSACLANGLRVVLHGGSSATVSCMEPREAMRDAERGLWSPSDTTADRLGRVQAGIGWPVREPEPAMKQPAIPLYNWKTANTLSQQGSVMKAIERLLQAMGFTDVNVGTTWSTDGSASAEVRFKSTPEALGRSVSIGLSYDDPEDGRVLVDPGSVRPLAGKPHPNGDAGVFSINGGPRHRFDATMAEIVEAERAYGKAMGRETEHILATDPNAEAGMDFGDTPSINSLVIGNERSWMQTTEAVPKTNLPLAEEPLSEDTVADVLATEISDRVRAAGDRLRETIRTGGMFGPWGNFWPIPRHEIVDPDAIRDTDPPLKARADEIGAQADAQRAKKERDALITRKLQRVVNSILDARPKDSTDRVLCKVIEAFAEHGIATVLQDDPRTNQSVGVIHFRRTDALNEVYAWRDKRSTYRIVEMFVEGLRNEGLRLWTDASTWTPVEFDLTPRHTDIPDGLDARTLLNLLINGLQDPKVVGQVFLGVYEDPEVWETDEYRVCKDIVGTLRLIERLMFANEPQQGGTKEDDVPPADQTEPTEVEDAMFQARQEAVEDSFEPKAAGVAVDLFCERMHALGYVWMPVQVAGRVTLGVDETEVSVVMNAIGFAMLDQRSVGDPPRSMIDVLDEDLPVLRHAAVRAITHLRQYRLQRFAAEVQSEDLSDAYYRQSVWGNGMQVIVSDDGNGNLVDIGPIEAATDTDLPVLESLPNEFDPWRNIHAGQVWMDRRTSEYYRITQVYRNGLDKPEYPKGCVCTKSLSDLAGDIRGVVGPDQFFACYVRHS